MQVDQSASDTTLAKQQALASGLHLAGLLILLFGLAAAGFMAQRSAASHPGNGVPQAQGAAHPQAIQFYCTALVIDWALFLYCYIGVRRSGGTLATLSGGRWHTAKDILVDLGIALPFWGLWEGVAYGLHDLLNFIRPQGTAAAAVLGLLPHSLIEVSLWILLCLTAGFCEEIVFRGYLQKQFRALTGSIVAAVILQGLVFGVTHGYQGWQNVTVISALGILYGMLAAWRRNLRVNIITHAWSDTWEGWLKFLLWH